jgi:hypothetical protein
MNQQPSNVATALDWLLEQASKAYEAEMAVQQQIRDRINFVFGLLITPITGAIISLFTTFKGNPLSFPNCVLFTLPILVASFFLGTAFIKLFKLLRVKTYYKAPLTPQQLFDFYNGGSNHEESLRETKHHQIKTVSEAVDHNIVLNTKRVAALIDAQRFAIIAVPFLAIACFKYFHSSFILEEPIVNVRVVNHSVEHPKENIMPKQSDTSNEQTQPSVEPAQKPEIQPPTKPLLPEPSRPAPEPRLILDHVDPSAVSNRTK